jgi:hypothetical protein
MLTSNGIILFSIFGPKTFNELSRSLQILYELDVPISSDFFLSEDEITNLLEKYFSQTDIQQQTIKKTYKSLQQLLNTIKYTGTRGLGLNGKVLTRKQIGQLEEIYKNKFKGIAATYEIFYCRAVKKD